MKHKLLSLLFLFPLPFFYRASPIFTDRTVSPHSQTIFRSHFLKRTTFPKQNIKSQSPFPSFSPHITNSNLMSLQYKQIDHLQKIVSMEIEYCPILHPTEEQFSKFYQYIHYLDRTYKKDYGMVKVVPPPGWKAQSADYHQKLENLTVKNAIEQNVQGMGGFFETKNIVQKKMTFKSYRKYSEKESSKVARKSVEQKQKLFWKTITYSPPIYGADLTGTLMDESAGAWNMNSLDSLLKYAFTQKVKGVTEPYCYIGTWKAFFSWHKEDLDLSAINYIHEGEPKVWYSIHHEDSYVLQNAAKKHYKEQYTNCKEFLRHKTILINPLVLLKENPKARVSKAVHNAGEIMLVFGGAYHCGFNCGFNIAQAVNYATVDWLRQMIHCKPCSCSKRSVKAQKEFILYNLEESIIFEDLLKVEQFQDLRSAVQYQQELEGNHMQYQADDLKNHQEMKEEVFLYEQQHKENIVDCDEQDVENEKIRTPKVKKIEKIRKDSNSHKTPKDSSKKKEKVEIISQDNKSTTEKNKLTSSEHFEHMYEVDNSEEYLQN